MSVKLRERQNADKTVSLILDIYHNGTRRYEFLHDLKLKKPSNLADREFNKQNRDLAKRIAVQKAQELAASDYEVTTNAGKKKQVVEWMQSYIDKYKKKDKRNMQGALNRFKQFLLEEKKEGLTFGKLTELIISDYQDFLRATSAGEGPASYFNRFKKMVKHAYREKLIANNPAADVKTIKGSAKKKDILTLDEIKTLANTATESGEVKRAFLFCCVTGLRWIDVKALKWNNINLSSKCMDIRQSKTEEEVTVNLNDTALKLLGEAGESSCHVFNLPTSNGCNKSLKAWVKRAGIQKAITWHNARHSFGTNLIYHGADVTTASSLLGHTSLRHTQRYIQAAKDLKERATDKLNIAI